MAQVGSKIGDFGKRKQEKMANLEISDFEIKEIKERKHSNRNDMSLWTVRHVVCRFLLS